MKTFTFRASLTPVLSDFCLHQTPGPSNVLQFPFLSVGFNYCGSFFFVFAAFASGPFYGISMY